MKTLASIIVVAAAAAAAPAANASDLLGFYVGAGVSKTEISGRVGGSSSVASFSFDESDTGWKAFAGFRALSLFGVEAEYADLGSARRTSGSAVGEADLDSKAIYGVFWLPIPAPIVDVYVKGGYARLDGTLTVRSGSTVVARQSLDDDVGAAGAGAQVKLGSWALRGEYQRYFASGSDPHLLSLSVAKFFL